MAKTIEEINYKIKNKQARVFRADEMTELVREMGVKKAAEKVDVVTTGTFGAMCSSGVMMNFGHPHPPIRMSRVSLNQVQAYAGLAAVDAYIGATQPSENRGSAYGGAHVIEDLLKGKPVRLSAESAGTDCYPRKNIFTHITLGDLNQALMYNPRNSYQRYNGATNSAAHVLYTYMGKLLPHFGNITFSGSGELSPLANDPSYRTIGLGTRIFLAGARGYVTGPGTQHNPGEQMGTLAVQGDLKSMDPHFLKAAFFKGYGCTLFLGLGIPIPILDEEMAFCTSVSDSGLFTDIADYGSPEGEHRILARVSYADLKSGRIDLAGKVRKTAPLCSLSRAKEVAESLKQMIVRRDFLLTSPVRNLPGRTDLRGLTEKEYARELTGNMQKKETVFRDPDSCIHCGLCVSLCKAGVFSADSSHRIHVSEQLCTCCGICEDACPVGAIHLPVNKERTP